MTSLGEHPVPEQLSAYGLGVLDDAASSVVYEHLEVCPTCRSVVETVADDSLSSLVRRSVLPLIATHQDDETAVAAGNLSLCRDTVIPDAMMNHPRYQVLGLLGAGGMGAVFKAEQRLMERLVALKVVQSSLTNNADLVKRFRQEVKAAARLSHPNIVTVHDADQAGDTHFLVMEFVEGTNLARLVAVSGPLAVSLACDCVRQAALGLQHAYEKGLVHRDIKPANLMRSSSGLVKILDFGLARLNIAGAGAAGPDTAPGMLLGTLDYMAPEQVDAAHQADIRADIYSLGCTFYFLLTGQPPFPGTAVLEKMRAHATQTPKPVTEFRHDVPSEALEILERMMAKDPAQRFQVPDEVAQALTSVFGKSSLATRPIPRSSNCTRGVTGHRRRRLLLCATLIAALALGGFLWAPSLVRMARNQGLLVIQSSDPGMQVIVKAGDKTIHDRTTERRFDLKPGEYEVEVIDSEEGIRFFSKTLTLERGGKATVTLPGGAPDEKGKLPECAVFGPLQGYPGGVAIAHSGRLALLAEGKYVRVWDLTTGRALRRLDGHTDQVWALAFSPDDQQAISGQQDNDHRQDYKLRLWDVNSGEQLREFAGHTETISGVAFHPGGRQFLSSCWDETVCAWDTRTGEKTHTFRPNCPVLSLAVSPDGTQALFGTLDGAVLVWDILRNLETARFTKHENRVEAVAYLPDGLLAASGSHDCTVRIWDVATGAERHCLRGHSGPVRAVAVTPDGRGVISASYDRTVRIWELQGEKEIHRFVEHTDRVNGVALSPQGRFGISCGGDFTARLWRLPQ